MKVVINFGDGERSHADAIARELQYRANWSDPCPFSVELAYFPEEDDEQQAIDNALAVLAGTDRYSVKDNDHNDWIA